MTCQSCEIAEQNPRTGRFKADCAECKARAIAAGREAFEAAQKGYMTADYRAALTKLFGADKLDEGHKIVKVWVAKIKDCDNTEAHGR